MAVIGGVRPTCAQSHALLTRYSRLSGSVFASNHILRLKCAFVYSAKRGVIHFVDRRAIQLSYTRNWQAISLPGTDAKNSMPLQPSQAGKLPFTGNQLF